jgi:hypothetical protein
MGGRNHPLKLSHKSRTISPEKEKKHIDEHSGRAGGSRCTTKRLHGSSPCRGGLEARGSRLGLGSTGLGSGSTWLEG